MSLVYDDCRENKVCDDCYAVLHNSDEAVGSELSPRRKAPGALQVSVIVLYL